MVYDSAVRDDQVFSRIAAILPHDTALRIARGRFFAHRGQWERAVREYAPVIGTLRSQLRDGALCSAVAA